MRHCNSRRPATAVAVLVLGLGGNPLAAQHVSPPTTGSPLLARGGAAVPGDLPPVGWLSPVLSVVVPGTGQLLADRDRGAIYLVAELLLVTRFLTVHSEGRGASERFRDLAFAVARGPFEPTVRDTAFEYFEQMERFIESGPFDLDPGPALVPPSDERTFNGSVWALARRTFFRDPDSIPDPSSEEYQRALEFYRRRAVGPNFQWSWRNAGLEHDLFRLTIRQSDEAFRRATQQLGLLLANHLLSALDAFIAHRLSANARPVEVRAMLAGADPNRRPGGLVVVSVRF